LIGAVIGNYQIVQKLGEGGMGVVYLGQHTLLGRRAAIKVLLPALSARPDIVNRFFNEARAVTTISDPGIVQVFDFGYHTDGSAFIVMEFLEGETLDRRLTRLGKLPVSEALRLCRQVASSLAAAHALGVEVQELRASTDAEIDAAFDTIAQQRIGAIVVAAGPFFDTRRDRLVTLAARYKVPAMYHFREFTEAGGLISYGVDARVIYRQIGVYAGGILNGEKPSNLPVRQPIKFELVINLKTAHSVGRLVGSIRCRPHIRL
jgi:serine/threonine protein kinase